MGTKVAILGGGMAALACAFELSDTPALREQYDITIYQLGWRLGGKCASGRNPGVANRIEEHGLHLWFGSYENAFNVTRRVYQTLNRPNGAPLATFEDAVVGWDDVVMFDQWNGRWSSSMTHFKPNERVPGDGEPIDDIWNMLGRGMEHVLDEWDHDCIREVIDFVERRKRRSPAGEGHAELVGLLKVIRAVAFDLFGHRLDDDAIRIRWMKVDFVTTLFIGLLADRVIETGFDTINHLDYREWLLSHGLHNATATGPTVRSWYDGAFAFVDGDPTRPNCSAGASAHAIMREQFGYKGHVLWHLTAGMGDAIIAPYYEALISRGVKVEFFQRVTDLGLDSECDNVETVTIQPQVALVAHPYQPLIDVDGLSCWPNEPLWDQIVDGAALRARRANPETHPELADGRPRVLRRGQDFDTVVLAISHAALEPLCRELSRDSSHPAFATMLATGATVMTQALQLWLNRPLQATERDGLGWPYPSTLAADFVEPIDTFADMSHLIGREQWEPSEVRSILYFCGVLDESVSRDADGATRAAHDQALSMFTTRLPGALPGLTTTAGGFDWNVLADRNGACGEQRFESQFWRANFELTERYVLSPAGTIAHRLRTDQSGHTNLFLAGDWVRTGLDLGCVEAAVMAGRQASRAICGSPAAVPMEDHTWLQTGSPP